MLSDVVAVAELRLPQQPYVQKSLDQMQKQAVEAVAAVAVEVLLLRRWQHAVAQLLPTLLLAKVRVKHRGGKSGTFAGAGTMIVNNFCEKCQQFYLPKAKEYIKLFRWS